MKLRYSEAFYSVQGEGRFVGVPSVFLRTFGCNFRCMNFGLDRNEPMRDEKQKNGVIHNQEVQKLIDDGVHIHTKEFNDLPIIHTGCDTYASIYPEFKKYNMLKDVDEVVEHLMSLTPNGKWVQDNGQDIHLIMTGGEPLLA
jgi:organic radical activating enzyme